MDRLWRQGVAFSLLVHAGVMGGGTLWAWLYSQPPTPPAPVRATLVGPETRTGAAEPEKKAAQGPQPAAEEEAQPAEPPESEPEPAPEPVTKSAPATSPKERVAEPEPDKAPEPDPKNEPEPAPDPEPEPDKTEPEPDAAEDQPETESEPDSAPETEAAASSSAQAQANDGGEAKTDRDILEGLGQAIDEAVTSGEGKGGQRLQAAQARFSAAVKKRISNRWSIPPGLRDRDDLEVTVRVALTPEGELERPPEVVRSNGPGYFNGSVVRAVKKAAPFPMPEGPTRAFQALKLRFSPDEVQ